MPKYVTVGVVSCLLFFILECYRMLHDVSWAINLLAAVVHSDILYCQKHIFRPWTTGAVRMPAGQNCLTVNGMRASKPAKDGLSACC